MINKRPLFAAACEAGRGEGDVWCVEWIKNHAMGSGPYMLREAQSGEYIVAVANKVIGARPSLTIPK